MKISFRKTWISFILALSVLFALAVPASAANVTYTGQTNTISAGSNHTAVIDENGDLWVWGSNWQGQIGNGGQGDVTISEPFGDGNPEHIITYKLQTTPVKVRSDVISVSCGDTFTAAIRSDGSLWMWGHNQFGELGNGRVGNSKSREMDGSLDLIQTTPVKVMDDVVSVSCGRAHACAVKSDGSLWAWGHNVYGPVGNGGKGNEIVIGWGNELTVQTVPVKIMDNVIDTACTHYSTAALKSDGTLWLWGMDVGDLLDSPNVSSPVQIASNITSFWLDGDGIEVSLSYINSSGTIQTFDRGLFVLPSSLDIKNLESCMHGKAVLRNDNSLWWMGTNCFDLYSEEISYQIEKIMDNVTSVSVGDNIFAVIKGDGSVWCWGENQYGAVGNGRKGEPNPGSPYYSKDSIMQKTPYQVSGITAKLPESTTIVVPDKPSAWAEQQVTGAINDGLVPEHMQSGYTEPISRADVAQMFINLIEKSSGKTIETVIKENGATVSSAFTDTNDPAVLYANALGIINGVEENRFDPDGLLTRAQCAVIINRAANVLGVQTDGYTHNFADLEGHWADDSLGWPVHAGIIDGVGSNRFAPDDPLTCEQAIVICYRALEYLKG